MWSERVRRLTLRGNERLGLWAEGSSQLAVYSTELISALARPEDWGLLTARAYDRNRVYLDRENLGLFSWEERVVDEFFPAPPARILVGAAGGGRELAALAERGYQVAGFEPAPRLLNVARGVVPSDKLLALVELSYEQISAGHSAPLDRHGPYAGAILGWGSLSHLGSDAIRVAAIRGMRRLAPTGPLVLSWVDDRPKERELEVRHRLAGLGLQTLDEQQGYSLVGGFSRTYSVDEIFWLAKETDHRVIRYDEDDYPHAVLRAIGDAS